MRPPKILLLSVYFNELDKEAREKAETAVGRKAKECESVVGIAALRLGFDIYEYERQSIAEKLKLISGIAFEFENGRLQ